MLCYHKINKAATKRKQEKQESVSHTMKKRSKAKLGELAHRWLVAVAGMLFLVAGGAKLISVFGDATIWKLPDPVLGWPWWLLMAAASIGEVGGWIAVRVDERSSFSSAVVAVVGGRFDFVSGYGLAFRGQGAMSLFGRVVGYDWGFARRRRYD